MPKVVTCLLINKDQELLILKRSNQVRTYKGMWGGVAGYIEKNEEPIDTAYKEIKEEVGLNKKNVKLIKEHDIIKFTDIYEKDTYDWEIFVFVFELRKKK